VVKRGWPSLQPACLYPAQEGIEVTTDTERVNKTRKILLELYLARSPGSYPIIELAREYGVKNTRFKLEEKSDCILCGLCVRASDTVDKKSVFAISGRGMASKLVFNSPDGKLGGSELSFTDKAVSVCPVGAILPKHLGYETPIGERLYDKRPISVVGDVASHIIAEKPFIHGDSHE